MDELIVFQEAQHVGFLARLLCRFDEAAQFGEVGVGGVVDGEVGVAAFDGFARLEDFAHLFEADGGDHQAAPWEYRYQAVDDQARHGFMHGSAAQADFSGQR